MPEQTPKLSLPLMQGAQAQKHVTHNEALELLDMLTQLTVEDFGAITPPSSPNEGQSWVIGTGATGAWAGQDDQLASWRGGGWLFVAPRPGWRAWSRGADEFRVYHDGAWSPLAGGGAVDFNNLAGVGVNATSDATNRLAVAAPASLFNHEGAGHQMKLNKAGVAETASLLYQTAFSGRAEMGLAGNDDFSIKVSPDGTTFTEALRVDAATGAVALPATPARQILPYHYRHYLPVDNGWCGPVGNAASFNASEDLGTSAEPMIAHDAKGVYVPAGTRLTQFVLAGDINSAEVIDIDLRLHFQYGPWGSWATGGATTRVDLASLNSAGIPGGTGLHRQVIPLAYTTPADGYVLTSVRPTAASVLTATRYFYLAGALEAACPAL